jgi:hypothetical protein
MGASHTINTTLTLGSVSTSTSHLIRVLLRTATSVTLGVRFSGIRSLLVQQRTSNSTASAGARLVQQAHRTSNVMTYVNGTNILQQLMQLVSTTPLRSLAVSRSRRATRLMYTSRVTSLVLSRQVAQSTSISTKSLMCTSLVRPTVTAYQSHWHVHPVVQRLRS